MRISTNVARCAGFAVCIAALTGCGTTDDEARATYRQPDSGDASAESDASVSEAAPDSATSFADDWGLRIRDITADTGTVSTCASVLPPTRVRDPDQMHTAIRAFVADATGTAPVDVQMTNQQCGIAGFQTCAGSFQHDLYKSNGVLGEAFYPLAVELEARAKNVEETIWVPSRGELSLAAAVCLAGIVEEQLVGVVMFNEPPPCP